MTTPYKSWAYSPAKLQAAVKPQWYGHAYDIDMVAGDGSLLAYGNGRSYGDSCLNSAGQVIDARALDHISAFDTETGIIRCEPGVIFADLLRIIVPKGWFLPVTPGTSYVTIGGAVANDVHGKNHHQDGTIGRYITELELLRSDKTRHICSLTENIELFQATIGGCGLTGFISQVELQLIPISSPYLEVETLVFHGLEEFMQLSTESKLSHQYTVAWLDCVSSGKNFARGIFLRANHQAESANLDNTSESSKLAVPFNLPSWALNSWSVKAFNTLYFHKHRLFSVGKSRQHYLSYFYPLDGIHNWNRIYGAGGFYQYQFVVPTSEIETMRAVLQMIVDSGQGSFLAVLKEFGDINSPGLMSFPQPGLCLALDFPNKGQRTLELLNQLDEKVIAANGSVYPAKDNRMSPAAFAAYYPQAKQFSEFIDPKFNSDFWTRVNGGQLNKQVNI